MALIHGESSLTLVVIVNILTFLPVFTDTKFYFTYRYQILDI